MEVAKVFLVFSCEVRPINDLGGPRAQNATRTLRRLRGALQCYNEEGRSGYFLVSGGCVASKKVQTKSHARIMGDWLWSQSDRPDRIIMEGEARDTYENVWLSFARLAHRVWFEQSPVKGFELYVATDEYHFKRILRTLTCWKMRRILKRKGMSFVNIYRIEPDSPYELSAREKWLESFLYLMHLVNPVGNNPIAFLNRCLRTLATYF